MNAWSNNRRDHVQDKGHVIVWKQRRQRKMHMPHTSHTYSALSVHFIFHLKAIQLDRWHESDGQKDFRYDFHFAFFSHKNTLFSHPSHIHTHIHML